jgi:hypothetical protein
MRSRRGVGGGGGMLMELNNEVVGISPEQRRLMTRELTANDYDTLLALDDDSEVRRGGDGRGGDEAVINRLPSYRVASGAKELTCSICLDPLAIGTLSLSLTHTHTERERERERQRHTQTHTCSICLDPLAICTLSLSNTHTHTHTHTHTCAGFGWSGMGRR